MTTTTAPARTTASVMRRPVAVAVEPLLAAALPWKETSKTDLDNRFVFYVRRDHVIDAAPYKKAIARFANDANGINRVRGITNNADYVQDGSRIFIAAKKDIPAGDEILVGYGREYWDSIRHNIRIERNGRRRT